MTRSLLPFVIGISLVLTACGPQGNSAPQAANDTDVLAGTENSKDFGDYVIHFNALTTDQLQPEVASEYGIVRSQNRALLNVSILRKDQGVATTAVAGAVAASALNLTGQLKNLLVREIREQNAIYYVAETPVANAETLIFTLDVTPQNEASRFTVRFQKQFFVD